MGQIDRPAAQVSLPPYARHIEGPSSVQEPRFADAGDDDPLVSARGIVNGVMFGALLWAVILWALL